MVEPSNKSSLFGTISHGGNFVFLMLQPSTLHENAGARGLCTCTFAVAYIVLGPFSVAKEGKPHELLGAYFAISPFRDAIGTGTNAEAEQLPAFAEA